MPEAHTLFDAAQTGEMVCGLARAVVARHQGEDICLVGIRTGGAHLAHRIAGELARLRGAAVDTGVMDITLYRDDWTRLDSRPVVGKTEISFAVAGRVVVLVDDVLYTGRTVRAALDAIIDFGRPRRIELAVLIDRGQRELPIQPDYVGARLDTDAGEIIDVLLSEEGKSADAVVTRHR